MSRELDSVRDTLDLNNLFLALSQAIHSTAVAVLERKFMVLTQRSPLLLEKRFSFTKLLLYITTQQMFGWRRTFGTDRQTRPHRFQMTSFGRIFCFVFLL